MARLNLADHAEQPGEEQPGEERLQQGETVKGCVQKSYRDAYVFYLLDDRLHHEEKLQEKLEENTLEEHHQEVAEQEQESEQSINKPAPLAENTVDEPSLARDDPIVTSSEHAEEQQEPSADDTQYDLEYPELPEDDETEENLDADGAHESVDTAAPAQVGEEYTEYEEYTEPRENDDEEEEYGENLPEDGVVEREPDQDSVEPLQDDFVLVPSSTTDESESDATRNAGNGEHCPVLISFRLSCLIFLCPEYGHDSNHEISKSDPRSDVPDELGVCCCSQFVRAH